MLNLRLLRKFPQETWSFSTLEEQLAFKGISINLEDSINNCYRYTFYCKNPNVQKKLDKLPRVISRSPGLTYRQGLVRVYNFLNENRIAFHTYV